MLNVSPRPQLTTERHFPAMEPKVYDTALLEFDVELAREVYDYLRTHPERHNQGTFLIAMDNRKSLVESYIGREDVRLTPDTDCGTVGCIAGTAALLSRGIQMVEFRPTWFMGNHPLAQLRALAEKAHGVGVKIPPITAKDVIRSREDGSLEVVEIEDYARERLGLGILDSIQIFYGRAQAESFLATWEADREYDDDELGDVWRYWSNPRNSELDSEADSLDTLKFFIEEAQRAQSAW